MEKVKLAGGAIDTEISQRLDLDIWVRIERSHAMPHTRREISVATSDAVIGGIADTTFAFMLDSVEEHPW